MKKIVLLFLCMLSLNFVNAQKDKDKDAPVAIPQLPIDPATGLYTYTEVIEIPGTSKDELYKRAFAWANVFYKNPTDVIREKNPQEGKILIKARFKISNEADKKGVVTAAGDVMYSLTLNFKDGKYKYEITKINWQQLSYYPIERWKDTSAGSYKPVYNHYLSQTDEILKAVIADFKIKIAEPPKVKSTDW